MVYNHLIMAGDGMITSQNGLARKAFQRYAAPTLKVYGGVIDLTASGSQAGNEGSGAGNIAKKN